MFPPLVGHVALIRDMGTRTGVDRGPRMSTREHLLSSSLLFLLETGSQLQDQATDGDIPGLEMTEGAAQTSPQPSLRAVRAIPELSGQVFLSGLRTVLCRPGIPEVIATWLGWVPAGLCPWLKDEKPEYHTPRLI